MPEEVKNTEVVGAEPTDTTVKAGAEPVGKDAKESDSSTEQVPWHKDARFQEFQKNKKTLESAANKLDGLLKANNVDDVEDLLSLIDAGKKVHGKVDDLDKIEEYVQKAKKLERYEEHWKRQDELKKRQEEDPQETVQRLERENEKIKQERFRESQAKKEAEEAAKAVSFYEGEVKTLISDNDSLSDTEKEFLAWTLGVGNECNDIQVTDRKAIKRVVNGGVKKYNELIKGIKEQGIKDYLAGKATIPIVPSGGSTPASVPTAPTLKTAASRLAAFKEMMGGKK